MSYAVTTQDIFGKTLQGAKVGAMSYHMPTRRSAASMFGNSVINSY